MNKTIKELATEFGVTKQAISKLLSKDFRANYVSTISVKGNNQLVVSEEGYKIIKSHYYKNFDYQPTTDNYSTKEIDNLVDTLRNQIKVQIIELNEKNNQISKKDDQISNMQKLLDQSQKLQLMTENKIKQLETKVDKSETENLDKKNPELNKKGFWKNLFS